jgi:hypothetical protein
MDERRATGTARNFGEAGEGFGWIAGDMQTQAKSAAKRMERAAEDFYGQTADAAKIVPDIVRATIEERPYTAVAVAFALGWFYGRTHRPF